MSYIAAATVRNAGDKTILLANDYSEPALVTPGASVTVQVHVTNDFKMELDVSVVEDAPSPAESSSPVDAP